MRGRGLRDCAVTDRGDRRCARASHSCVRRAVRESDRPALAGATDRAFGSAARQNACAWRGGVKENPGPLGLVAPPSLPRERRRRWRRAPRLGSLARAGGIPEGTFVRYPAAANWGTRGQSRASPTPRPSRWVWGEGGSTGGAQQLRHISTSSPTPLARSAWGVTPPSFEMPQGSMERVTGRISWSKFAPCWGVSQGVGGGSPGARYP
jgi:hypothetical protein